MKPRTFAWVAGILLCGALGAAAQEEEPLHRPKVHVPTIDDDAEATWRTLTWDDFRRSLSSWRQEAAGIASQVVIGRFKTQTMAQGSSVLAQLEWIEVFAVMSKLESGFKPGGRKDRLLSHEQVHFDIAEVCARLLRTEMGDVKGLGADETAAQRALEADLRQRHEHNRLQCAEIQTRYDDQTGHGTKRGAQKTWRNKVARWLDELEAGRDIDHTS